MIFSLAKLTEMLWNLSEPSCDYYWLLYGIDLLQHKKHIVTVCPERIADILKLKFNPSFHKKQRDPDARSETERQVRPETFTIPNRTITTLL